MNQIENKSKTDRLLQRQETKWKKSIIDENRAKKTETKNVCKEEN